MLASISGPGTARPASSTTLPWGRISLRRPTQRNFVTLQVGACTVALKPLHDRIADHVLAAQRLHADDTPVPVLAKGKTATARAWVYVRDDTPFGGADPPAALFRYSRDRSGDHPVEHLKTFTGILQADIYAGFNRLYAAGRQPGPIIGGACWAHSRRKFYELADIAASKKRGKTAPPISPLEAFTKMPASERLDSRPVPAQMRFHEPHHGLGDRRCLSLRGRPPRRSPP